MINNEEIIMFRKEKLPIYIGLINNSVNAQKLYDYITKKRETLQTIKNIDKQYIYKDKIQHRSFEFNKKLLIKRVKEINQNIKELKQIMLEEQINV